jgi:hypothetical protein
MLSSFKEGGSFYSGGEPAPKALALTVQHYGQGDRLLSELSYMFLKERFSVQYLTASRHPIEFIIFLKQHLEQKGLTWLDYTRRIVVIDGYSPHFAFTDSIYEKKRRELESFNITCINAKMTYAGMHSASSRAFNVIQAQCKDENRKPTLIIYEDTYALSDLESIQQYRIFVRHIIPSERMWDGMFTVFLEVAQPDSEWMFLQANTSMSLDLRYCPSDGEDTTRSFTRGAEEQQH